MFIDRMKSYLGKTMNILDYESKPLPEGAIPSKLLYRNIEDGNVEILFECSDAWRKLVVDRNTAKKIMHPVYRHMSDRNKFDESYIIPSTIVEVNQ